MHSFVNGKEEERSFASGERAWARERGRLARRFLRLAKNLWGGAFRLGEGRLRVSREARDTAGEASALPGARAPKVHAGL